MNSSEKTWQALDSALVNYEKVSVQQIMLRIEEKRDLDVEPSTPIIAVNSSLVKDDDIVPPLIKEEEKGTPSPSKAGKTGVSQQIIYVVLGLLLCLMLYYVIDAVLCDWLMSLINFV